MVHLYIAARQACSMSLISLCNPLIVYYIPCNVWLQGKYRKEILKAPEDTLVSQKSQGLLVNNNFKQQKMQLEYRSYSQRFSSVLAHFLVSMTL